MKRLLGVVVAALMSGTANAEAPLTGGTCVLPRDKTVASETVWNCDYLGNVTIRQIYEQGFRVVATIREASSYIETTALIIEKTKK